MFNNKVFFDYLLNDDVNGAMNYVEENVPDYLYKFYSLSDSDDELSRKKLDTLRSNSNWFDLVRNQNDPLDMKMAYIDETNKKVSEKAVDVAKTLLNDIINSLVICSFIDSNEENLQMWAHYANNHQGYCIKYKIDNKKAFFKIMYEDKRIPTLSIPLNLYNEMEKSDKQKSETKLLEKYRYLFILLLNIKHSSWSNEKEYRLIYPKEKDGGSNLNNETIGIKPVEMYLGLKCSDKNKSILKSIAENNLNCKCYEAFISDTKILDFKEYNNVKTNFR